MPNRKNIALFIDGTWEANDGCVKTNVGKLFEACNSRVGVQSTYYLSGVGAGNRRSRKGAPSGTPLPDKAIQKWAVPPVASTVWPLNRLLGGATGLGMGARIREAYAFLVSEYNRANRDKIFIFGFSRGAFAARSLAGFISKVGVLMKEYIQYVPEAFKIYESGTDEGAESLKTYLVKLTGRSANLDDRNDLPVHFLGVWDTVGALGLPWHVSERIAKRTNYHDVKVPPNVFHARHAMALHELRKHFPVLLWENKENHQNLKQVWFPGAHGDVGGGYPDDESGLSTDALCWMAHEAAEEGLLIDFTCAALKLRPSANQLHHKVRWLYALFKPKVRPQLQALLDGCEAATPDAGHACLFHDSARQHLRTKQHYSFFSSRVNAVLAQADDIATELCLWSLLRYNYQVVETLEHP
ncbi:Tle1 phospholipase domain-containing protein [Paraburkholderia kururiensis]